MATFVPDPTFEKQLQHDPEYLAYLDRVANEAAAAAKAAAPRDTGEYADSISGEVVHDEGKARARVSSDDPKWPYIEFGTEDTPAFAPLRRPLDRKF
jgi:hypothetical protein